MECTEIRYRIDRREIGFVKFILEAYDGIAVVSTVDARRGVVSFRSPPGCESVLKMVLQDLSREILIERVPGPNDI